MEKAWKYNNTLYNSVLNKDDKEVKQEIANDFGIDPKSVACMNCKFYGHNNMKGRFSNISMLTASHNASYCSVKGKCTYITNYCGNFEYIGN